MARQPRLTCAGQVHHLLQFGNNRQDIFRDEQDREQFLQWLRDASKQFQVAIHAYVLMPNHLHLLATPSDQTGLSRLMQWLGRHYVPYFNRKYARGGTLFQGRFKTAIIEAVPHLINCMRYIESNPVRVGIAASVDVFRWSSYAHHAGIKADAVVTDHSHYWSLGNTPFQREAAYRLLIEQELNVAEVETIATAVSKGHVLGSQQFQAALSKLTGRAVAPAKRGRPAKPRENREES